MGVRLLRDEDRTGKVGLPVGRTSYRRSIWSGRRARDGPFDFSSLFWVFFAIMVLQPLFMGRWYAMRRAQAIRALEKSHASRVITMILRQEKRSLFGFAVSRNIDLEDAQTIIAAIKETPDDVPIDLVIHTPGGPSTPRRGEFPVHKKDLRVELRAAADLAPYAPGGPETAGAHLIAQ